MAILNLNTVTDTVNNVLQKGGYYLEKDGNYNTPETRALTFSHTDPLSLCFKVLIDYDKPYGLFAPETNVDSALAYLKRLEGSSNNIRYAALVNFIDNVKLLCKYYDFLFMEIEGLGEIFTYPAHNMYIEKDAKINIKLRETIDMRVSQIIDAYKNIAFDYERACDVLPDNLRRFDMHVIVFPIGYYNMALYGEIANNDLTEDEKMSRKILPTLDKINEATMDTWKHKNFNNICFDILDCQFVVDECGKTLFESMANESSSNMASTNLSISYRFASTSGIFNNTRGEIDLVNALAQAAAQNRIDSTINLTSTNVENQTPSFNEITNKAKNNIKSYFKDVKSELQNSGKTAIDLLKNAPKKILNNVVRGVIGSNTPIGNAYRSFSASNIGKMIKNTVELGIDKVNEKVINETVVKLNGLMKLNYNDNLYDFYKNEVESRILEGKKTSPVKIIENEKIYPETSSSSNFTEAERRQVQSGSKYVKEIGNIYNRKGF